MSIRSRIFFLIGSLFVFSLLTAGFFATTAVSAQADFPLLDAKTNHAIAAGNTVQYSSFAPVISNYSMELLARKKTKVPVQPTATKPAPTMTPAQPAATNIAPTVAPAQPTATNIAPTAVPVQPTATRPAPTATPVLPTATKPAPTPTASSATRQFYVSTTGSDTNPGTLASPWRTIQKAANTVVAGDTVVIRAGTYRERVVITRSGNATAGYITFMNYPGETPVIDGTGIAITPSAGLVHMGSVGYIKIAGLKVMNSDDAGIFARSSHHIVVQSNSTQNTHSSGVGIWASDNVLVENNRVVDARYVTISQGGHEESISIVSTTNFEVRNNDVSLQNNTGYLGNEGIDVKESSRYGKVHHNYIHNFPSNGGAIYVDAWRAGLDGTPTLSNIEIYNNVISNAGSITVGAERGGTAENIKIYNNLVINGPAAGISISNTGYTTAPNGNGPKKNIEIYNNTIYKARWNGGAGIYVVSSNISNIVIRNNITNMDRYNGQIVVAVPSALAQVKADHNLVYGSKYCAQDFPSCVEVSNVTNSTIFGNITADPRFVDLTSTNLHLAAGSPAIDRGLNLSANGVTADMDGVARPQGGGYDIGAYEYR